MEKDTLTMSLNMIRVCFTDLFYAVESLPNDARQEALREELAFLGDQLADHQRLCEELAGHIADLAKLAKGPGDGGFQS